MRSGLTDFRYRAMARFLSGVTALSAAALSGAAQAQDLAAKPDSSVLGTIMNADAVVKAVMLVLVGASILSWALWFIKRRELRAARADLIADIKTLTGAPGLGIEGIRYPATARMIAVADTELESSGPNPTHRMLEGVEDRVGAQLPMVEARAVHHIQWGGNVLASIGSISPFVGLAGTVWGIVHSFLGIAESQSTSLSVVAPGIAEALIATAMGLAAAIPAVLIYNGLTRSIAGYRRLLNEVAVLTACILSREVERKDQMRDPAVRGETRVAIVPVAEAR